MNQMTFTELNKIAQNSGPKKGNVAILPPMDVFESIEWIRFAGIEPRVAMLDP